MNPLFIQRSLPAQTAGALRSAIAAGEWPRWLPSEADLSRMLQVSRSTMRAALALLENEGLISAGQGRRREVLIPASEKVCLPRKTVALLTPEPLHRLPGSTVFWVDALREQLDAAGRPLEIHVSTAAYRRRPAKTLEEMHARLQPAAWVLYRSEPAQQAWFSEHGLPAVIAGSAHPGSSLASVDVDYAAACRHAAGRLLAAGHKHLALVRPDTMLAGDMQSIAGFAAGAGKETRDAVHDRSVPGICKSLERIFAAEPRPTGLLVFHASHFLTVLGWLQSKGLRVPRDVSVICRDDEPYLESMLPRPARYSVDAAAFGKKIFRAVAAITTKREPVQRKQLLMPGFIPGDTLAKAI